jgi:hypothetical protein
LSKQNPKFNRQPSKALEFVPANFEYDEELKPIIENESQRDIDEQDASPHKRKLGQADRQIS